jgi:hypothetical protein
MATTSKSTAAPSSSATPKSKGTPTSEQTVSRIRGLNQTRIDLVKKSGHAYLDSYEKALHRVLDFERAAASRSRLPWVTAFANTHTQFVQNVTSPYVKIARDALK